VSLTSCWVARISIEVLYGPSLYGCSIEDMRIAGTEIESGHTGSGLGRAGICGEWHEKVLDEKRRKHSREITVFFGHCSVVTKVGVYEHAYSAQILRALDLLRMRSLRLSMVQAD